MAEAGKKVAEKAKEIWKGKERKDYFKRGDKEKRHREVDGKREYCGKDTQLDEPFQLDSAEGDHIDPDGSIKRENQANSCRECNGPGGKGDKKLGKEWKLPNPNNRIKERIKEELPSG